jgi:SagB-type dehydrogenase family enzyme
MLMAPDESAVVPLPRPQTGGGPGLDGLLALRRSVRSFSPVEVPLESASQLLWAAQGITRAGGLRTTASAGALYPLELYLTAGKVTGLEPGLFHYDPTSHSLRLHTDGDLRVDLADAAVHQHWIARAPAILVIAGVHARSAVKYTSMAPRYVHIEAGNAAGHIALQAVALGLETVMVGALSEPDVQRVLGLSDEVRPLLLMPVGRQAG